MPTTCARTPQQEAARIIREAEGRAELTLQRTQAKTEDIEREIDGLTVKRREAEGQPLEGTIAALHNTLDFIREQDPPAERDDRVVQHRPKIGPVAATRPA